jgi:hypothetical protein
MTWLKLQLVLLRMHLTLPVQLSMQQLRPQVKSFLMRQMLRQRWSVMQPLLPVPLLLPCLLLLVVRLVAQLSTGRAAAAQLQTTASLA